MGCLFYLGCPWWIKVRELSKAMSRPRGDITTLLDLTDRDDQDSFFSPVDPAVSWFTRAAKRRYTPFTPCIQEFAYRGPASFGQRISFDLKTQTSGDVVHAAFLQIKLAHWLNLSAQLQLASGTYEYVDPATAWFYANSLGTALIQKAELEIDGDTIEEIDGDFINVCSALFTDLNTQVASGPDALGKVSMDSLKAWSSTRVFPTEDGYVHCPLSFYFMRTRLKEYLPLLACKDGSVRLHITFRPLAEVVRQARGYRDTCTSVPLDTTVSVYDRSYPFDKPVDIITDAGEPMFESVRLVTYGALLDGAVREKMYREPFELMHREVQTFYFAEPLKYAVVKAGADSVIRVQLPLEANHPIEEIIWFIRRKEVSQNNEWTNYSAVLEREYDSVYNAKSGLLTWAKIQADGIDVISAEEQYFRQQIAGSHRGGITAFNSFIYGYSFARRPSELHQPSGSINASRLQSLRLVLDIQPPGGSFGGEWEVKVFCLGLNWLRFQNGLANRMFED